MTKSKVENVWSNNPDCCCNEMGCNPKTHKLCGYCGNQSNIDYLKRRIMKSARNDENSEYGWNIDHVTPISKGGTDKTENLRAVHITCNRKRTNK